MWLGKAFQLLRVQTSIPAWIRLYSTAAKRAADHQRAFSTDPQPGSGVIAEVATSAGSLSVDADPVALGASLESSPSENIAMAVTNRSSSDSPVELTLTRILGEL